MRQSDPARLSSAETCIGLIGSISAQLMAGKAMFETLGMNGTVGVIVLALVVPAHHTLSYLLRQ